MNFKFNNDCILIILLISTLVLSIIMIVNKRINCLINLVVVILLTRYFTKNNSLILLTGILSTVFFSLSCILVENLENKEEDDEEEELNIDDEDIEDNEDNEDNEVEEMVNLSPASLNDKPMEITNKIDKVGKLDHAASVEAAYDNLDKILSSNAIQNMSKDTARLAEKQENLIKQLKNFQPIMEQASGMLKSFGNFDLNKLFDNKKK